MTYPTVTDVKTWLNISGATEDSELGFIVDGIKGFVEEYTGRVFVAASTTKTFEACAPYVSGDKRRLNLFTDLVSVTSITNGDGSVLSASDYSLYPDAAPYYEIHLDRRGVRTWQSHVQAISIEGSWGYSAACPDSVFHVILELCQFAYNALHSGSGGPTLVSSRQTGMVVGPDTLPPRLRLALDQWRR